MRKALMVLAVGVFVLGGATIAVAQTEEGEEPPFGPVGSAIQEVLDELVADGSNGFTQSDADLVVEALTEKREAMRAEREALHEQMEEFWSDGQLTADEISMFRDQLSTILDYASRLQELDTSSIPPTATVLPVHSVMAQDEPQPSMPRDQVLSNAPHTETDSFRVWTILED